VLLADEPHGDNPAGAQRDRGAKEFLELKDSRAVVPERPVPKVSCVLLAGVEPLMKVQILTGLAAEPPGGAHGVVIRMGHG
jgi:hypothetical protein